MEAKAAIRGLSDDEYDERRRRYRDQMSNPEKLVELVRASGILGPIDLLMSFNDARDFDQSPILRALGPTAAHAEVLFKYGPHSPEFIKRSTPVLGVVAPGIWRDWLKEAKAQRREEARSE